MSVHLRTNGFVEELERLPIDDILDYNLVQMQCFNIGQRIYSDFKSADHGHWEEGKKGMELILSLMPMGCAGDELRKQLVAKAWRGVGDCHWHWGKQF